MIFFVGNKQTFLFQFSKFFIRISVTNILHFESNMNSLAFNGDLHYEYLKLITNLN